MYEVAHEQEWAKVMRITREKSEASMKYNMRNTRTVRRIVQMRLDALKILGTHLFFLIHPLRPVKADKTPVRSPLHLLGQNKF